MINNRNDRECEGQSREELMRRASSRDFSAELCMYKLVCTRYLHAG